ncbi:hypothetical protein N0V84_012320 [Fusarium piperis]|uniref:Uncharacterized protein n=1 Tax=Fusarium piperis TaxID=1435070 RepID=A0A9W8W2C8_9HYPO|nr:hypothetical protein N0V84_012320 [Fusarium piperis]
MTPIRSDVSESSTRPRGRRRPPRKSKTSEEPPSSQRRQTRSHTDNQAFESLSPPRRKRRRTISEPDDQPAKRQDSHDVEGVEEEEKSSQNHDRVEDNDDDGSAPPGLEFFKNINKTILPDAEQIHKLPELRPGDSAEYHSENEGRTGIIVELSQNDNEAADEAEAEAEAENDAVVEVEAEIEDSQAEKDIEIMDETPVQAEGQEEPSPPAEQPTSMEQLEPTEQDDPGSRPDPSQPNPSQSSKQKKRRQRRKVTFGEPDYQVSRAASPVLGSDPPRSQARKPSKPKQTLLSQAQKNALYEIVGSDEEDCQEQQQGEEQGQTSTVAAQAARKKGRTQSQATRSSTGTRKDVAENTVVEVEDGSYADDDSEADEEPPELEPEAEGESGDGVESGDELEEENDATYLEDSLLIEPPKENEPVVVTKIHGKVVQKLVTIMTASGWMGKRKWDKDAKLEGASAKRDFKEALKKDLRPLASSRVILAHTYDLWKLCHKLPRLPQLDEQNKYFREHKTQFGRLITKTNDRIELYISTIMKQMESGSDAPANHINNRRIVSKLHRSIIPMLVWLLRDAFLAGCDISDDKMQQAVNHTGEFTLSTLQLLTRISGWIWRLCEVLLDWSDLHPPKPAEKKEDWQKLRPAVKTMRDEINQAIKKIDDIQKAPERRKKALEHDRAVQRERKKRLQQEKEVLDQQMKRFVESTQRTSSSQQVSHRPATKTGSRSHRVAQRLSQEQEAEYFEKEGWHFWEDDELLKAIRSVLHPNYKVLASTCPGRSLTEVKERVKHLKDTIRSKYERIGTEPPLWTYEHE